MFRRENDHLVVEMPLGYAQAALGAHVEVPTLQDRASIVIPKGTQHGTILKVENAGIPNLRSGKRGDLLVVILIEVPKKLNDNQEELLRQLAELEHEEGILPHKDSFWTKVKDIFS